MSVLLFIFSASQVLAFTLGELHNDVDMQLIKCDTFPKCESQAELCGFLAGMEAGSDVCKGEKEPNPDYVWAVKEIRVHHCMGALPIITAQSNTTLEQLFKASYFKALESFKASCKK